MEGNASPSDNFMKDKDDRRPWKVGSWPKPEQIDLCAPKIRSFKEMVSMMPFTFCIVDCRVIPVRNEDVMVVKIKTQYGAISEAWAPKSLCYKLKTAFQEEKQMPYWCSVQRKDERSFDFKLVPLTDNETTSLPWALSSRVEKSPFCYSLLLDRVTVLCDKDNNQQRQSYTEPIHKIWHSV